MDFINILINKLNLADTIDTDITNEVLDHAKNEFSDIIQKHKNDINFIIENESQFIESLEAILNVPIIALNIVTLQYEDEEDKRWADDTFAAFLTNIRKLFEFLLKLLLQYKNIHIIEHYISYNNDVKNLIENYIVHGTEIGLDFHINDTKSKNRIEYLDTPSNVKILIESDYKVAKIGEDKKVIALQYHFGLHNDWYYKIYYKIPKSKSSKSSGGGGTYKRLKYDKKDLSEQNRLSRSNNNADNPHERNETKTILNIDYYPLILGIKQKDTHYNKKLQLSARASRIGKANNKLSSDYNIPLTNNLSTFIQQFLLNTYAVNTGDESGNLIKNLCNEFKDKAILFCIFSGYSIEKLLEVLLNKSSDIDKKNNSIIYKNDVKYAKLLKDISDYTFQKASKSNTIIIEMPNNLNRIFSFLRTNIHIFLNSEKFIFNLLTATLKVKIKKDQYEFENKKNLSEQFYNFCENEIIFRYHLKNLEENIQIKKIQEIFEELQLQSHLFNIIKKSISKYLAEKVEMYSIQFKKISLKINNLEDILLHTYYRKSKTKSNVHMLFLKQLNYYDYGAMSYATVSDQLYVQSSWLFRLQQLLKIDESLNKYTSTTQNNPVEQSLNTKGSPFYIFPGKFKNFFYTLDSNIVQFSTVSYIQDSLAMIYLRYAFSILLFTRDNKESCNLSNICYDPAIFAISEKNTDEHSSIRIVPLTKTTLHLITYFYQIKLKYNVNKDVPFLINEDNSITYITSQTQILQWIKNLEQTISIFIDTKFIKTVPLNIGRHILTTISIERNFKNDYLAGLLDHYQNGTNVQGIYSAINNENYFEESAKLINFIGDKYLPKYPLSSYK